MFMTTWFTPSDGRRGPSGLSSTLAFALALAVLPLARAVAQVPQELPAPPPQGAPPPLPGTPPPLPGTPDTSGPLRAPSAEPAQLPEDAFPPALPEPPVDTSAPPPTAAVATDLPATAEKPGPPKGDPFSISSGNGAYKLRIGLQTGIKAEGIVLDGDLQNRNPFFVIRPLLAGHVVEPWIKFWFSMELANNPPYLLDGYIDLNPCDAFGLRVGQQYTPFSRHESFGPQQLLFPEFSTVANYFWSGRDKGATIFGSLLDKRVDYYAGFYGGSPLRQFTILDGNYVVEGRVTWSPLGPTGGTEYPYIVHKGEGPAPFRPSFTFNGYYGKIRAATENFNPSTFSFVAAPSDTTTKSGTLGADIFLQGSRFVFFAEGYYRRTRPNEGVEGYNSWGAWGQVGVLLIERRLDVAVRGSWINPSNHVANDRFLAIEAQFAYYFLAPYVVLKLRYGYGVQRAPDMMAETPSAQGNTVALASAAGKLHIGTLQLNLSF